MQTLQQRSNESDMATASDVTVEAGQAPVVEESGKSEMSLGPGHDDQSLVFGAEAQQIQAVTQSEQVENEVQETLDTIRAAEATNQWQLKNLRLMQFMIVGMGLIFFAATIYQINQLQKYAMDKSFLLEPTSLVPEYDDLIGISKADYAILKATTTLEGHVINQRYRSANVSMFARVWIRFLGFFTGMILSLVGATFILGKLREENQTTVDTGNRLASLSFSSASPGVILVILGFFLMSTTVVVRHDISIDDAPTYFQVNIPNAQ